MKSDQLPRIYPTDLMDKHPVRTVTHALKNGVMATLSELCSHQKYHAATLSDAPLICITGCTVSSQAALDEFKSMQSSCHN